ncbi:MAG: TolC family protein [Gammaproteobacteria bacterium]|nr:TolC family protein [Gammaproteobacteria bacterium]MBU1646268.1 TolC family protein [Gammaproteobacteria bacterium]MBU1971194.1 TolC family protein [Gammaproteobacteria bacterium]
MTKLLPLALALALTGCSFAPEYKRPAAPVPSAWPAEKVMRSGSQPDGAGGTAKTFSDDWKSFFTDPQLQDFIAAALEHNRDLRIALARVDEARALAGIAGADRLPMLDMNVQRQAALTPGDLSGTGRAVSSQRYDANFGIAAFELDFWGRVKNLDDAARANFLASDYAQRAFRLTLIGDVAAAWYSLRELDARAALADATAQSREQSRTLVGKRRDVGLAGDLDFLAADGAWATARAEAANLARQKAAAANALRLLVGSDVTLASQAANPTGAVPPGDAGARSRGPACGDATVEADAATATSKPASRIPLADASPPPCGAPSAASGRPTFSAPPEIAVDLPSEVLLRRPDVLAAEQKLIAANANIGAARAAFLPRISLTAVAGSASRALSGLFDSGSGAWSFVPLLKLPLFDAGRSAGNVDLAQARKNIAVAEYEKTIQQAFREVADLLAARERYAEQLKALEAAAAAQDERLQRVEARHLAGVSSYLELLDAQRERFAAQQSVLATQRGWLATAASLYKALGGTGPAAN